MKIYLITDTHFYHDKMPLYCGRPDDFTELIGHNLSLVPFKEDDVLIHLGDICIGHDEESHARFIAPLRCKKWLIKGNHDGKSNNWYISHGWDWVGYKFQDKFFGKNIMFSHTPERFVEVNQALFGAGNFDINIHGHFHNMLPRLLKKEFISKEEEYRNTHDLANLTERHKLLAIEYTNYKPVLLENFIK